MTNVKDINKALGVDNIAKRINVTATAVYNAGQDGMYPPSWFAVLSQMGREAGVDIPLAVFRWKGATQNLVAAE